jgi:hypothetical protein
MSEGQLELFAEGCRAAALAGYQGSSHRHADYRAAVFAGFLSFFSSTGQTLSSSSG